MTVGLYIANNAGIMQIDSSSPVMSYMGMATGTTFVGNEVVGPGFVAIGKNYGGLDAPAVALRAEYPISAVVIQPSSTDPLTTVVLAQTDRYLAVPVEAYFFDTPRNPTTYGLHVYHETTGKMLFDSSKKLVVVHDTIALSPGNGYVAQRTYSTGRRYAVIANGVMSRVIGSTVYLDGAWTSVAKTGGTINAIVIDVTGY